MPAPRPAPLGRRCAAELIGTALLVLVGLSVVTIDLGHASPLATVLPSVAARRAVTGFLFGTTGALIALSALGRVSGAHINPVVSLAFWVERTLSGRDCAAFVASQLAGAVLGAVPLLAWGARGRSVAYGATVPGPRGAGYAVAGEVATTFVLVVAVLSFVGHPRLRRWTPAIFPPMYCVMVWLEAPWSGTSTNPARSLGPDLIRLAWGGYWIYWVGPLAGLALAVVAWRTAPVLRDLEVHRARLAHFHEPGRSGAGRRSSRPAPTAARPRGRPPRSARPG